MAATANRLTLSVRIGGSSRAGVTGPPDSGPARISARGVPVRAADEADEAPGVYAPYKNE